MANKIIPKRSSVSGKVPATTDLDVGEIAVNLTDRKIFTKDSGGTVVQLGGGAGSGDVVGPNASTDNAIARFDLASGKLIQNSSATIDDSGNLTATSNKASGTGANKMPVGTTAQRPAGQVGMYRMNSTTGEPEWFDPNTGSWISFAEHASYSVDVLVVAGGGGGGGSANISSWTGGGGGGAGGYVASSTIVQVGSAISVTIGGGGAGGAAGYSGSNGSNSSFGAISAIGGGGGGAGGNPSNADRIGKSGGSGGGTGYQGLTSGSGTSGQGFAGGIGGADPTGSGGGGGASAAGQNGQSINYGGGNGGNGSTWLDSVTYAGGGGAGHLAGYGGQLGAGGSGGGGGGATTSTFSGSANKGGGGGGGSRDVGTGAASNAGGAGGSGVVVLRYPGIQRGVGGSVALIGGYTYHTFTASGTFTA